MAQHKSHHIFSIYTDPDSADAPIEVIAERFSFWAFLFHGFWLIYHRAYLSGIIWFMAYGAVGALSAFMGIPEDMIAIIQLGMQIWLGFEGHSLRAQEALRKGMQFEGVYIAHNAQDAELRYLETHPRYKQHPV